MKYDFPSCVKIVGRRFFSDLERMVKTPLRKAKSEMTGWPWLFAANRECILTNYYIFIFILYIYISIYIYIYIIFLYLYSHLYIVYRIMISHFIRDFSGIPNSAIPFPSGFKYHSHSSGDCYGSGLGVPLSRVAGISLDYNWYCHTLSGVSWFISPTRKKSTV